MNKLIKELMDQAFEGIQVVDEIEEHHLEKFAELLIQECANLNFRGTGFVTSEGEDMVRSMIKQHFGVEE